MKSLEIDWTKEKKDLYNEHYHSLRRELRRLSQNAAIAVPAKEEPIESKWLHFQNNHTDVMQEHSKY